MKQSTHLALALALALGVAGCAGGLRLAHQYDMDDAHNPQKMKVAVKDMAGWNPANGMPTLAERFASRKGLKLAILQASVTIQGDTDTERTASFSSQSAGNYIYTETEYTVVKGLKVPATVGVGVAELFARKLEESLKAQGLPVIPYERVTATQAYQKAYGKLPQVDSLKPKGNAGVLMDLFGGWSTYAAPGMRARAPQDLTKVNGAPLFVPDATIQAIEKELGEDVLFISAAGQITHNEVVTQTKEANVHQISHQTWYNYDRKGHYRPTAFATLYDPDYVGVGPMGLGVLAGTLDASFKPAPRPDYIKKVGGDWEVAWPSFVNDSVHAYGAMAQAFGASLKDTIHPPKQ